MSYRIWEIQLETISKNLFLNAVLCATLGWRLRADESLDEAAFASPTLAEQFRMELGAEIGRRARKLFPEGVLISTGNLSKRARLPPKRPSSSVLAGRRSCLRPPLSWINMQPKQTF